jgi:myo-inositol-1(or 4)-monophosphatase
MNPQEILIELCSHVREAVRPHLGAFRSRAVSGTAASGDATFAIDDRAEDALVEFIERRGLSLALYTEDKGLVEFGDAPEAVLVVDPIDGTRPAAAGFESCVVSIAWASYKPSAAMADVQFGCIQEIKSGAVFFAERGSGARRIAADGTEGHTKLLPIRRLCDAPLSFEACARPFEYLGIALGEVVDKASLTGGCFLFNSTAYSLTRLVTGQLAAVLDVGNRMLCDIRQTRDRFSALGRGRPIGLFTYDIAAAALIAQEAGAVVTDAYGHSFDSTPLLDTSEQNLTSIIAASTPELHAEILESVDRGLLRLAESMPHEILRKAP